MNLLASEQDTKCSQFFLFQGTAPKGQETCHTQMAEGTALCIPSSEADPPSPGEVRLHSLSVLLVVSGFVELGNNPSPLRPPVVPNSTQEPRGPGGR